MTRPIRDAEREAILAALVELAGRLAKAQPALDLLHTTTQVGYPPKASTAPNMPHNQVDEDGEPIPPDTLPEAFVIHGDRPANDAAHHLRTLRRIGDMAATLNRALAANDPDRQVCPDCGHPYAAGETRCQRIVDGRQCGARRRLPGADTERVCKHTGAGCPRDGRPLTPGEHLRNGECPACAQRTRRSSNRIARIDRLQLADNVITTEQGEPAP